MRMNGGASLKMLIFAMVGSIISLVFFMMFFVEGIHDPVMLVGMLMGPAGLFIGVMVIRMYLKERKRIKLTIIDPDVKITNCEVIDYMETSGILLNGVPLHVAIVSYVRPRPERHGSYRPHSMCTHLSTKLAPW